MKNFRVNDAIIRLKEVNSTNNYLSDLLKTNQELTEGTVILSHFQKQGRGQAGNSWESDAGKNLCFSILLLPHQVEAKDQFLLSMATSLSLIECLQSFGIPAQIKWPNDIIIPHKKIAGILIEHALMGNQIQSSVVGVGININQNKFKPYPVEATSLGLETGKEHDIFQVLQAIIIPFNKWINCLYNGDYNRIKIAYDKHLYLIHSEHKFYVKNKPFIGIIEGINAYGQLLVRNTKTATTEAYNFKEISFYAAG